MTSGVLKYLEFYKPFEVHIDTSNFAIGVVLVQDRKLAAYESKKLVGAQENWPKHHKGLFVVVHYLKAWKHYLRSTVKTKVFTDNISLKYFES